MNDFLLKCKHFLEPFEASWFAEVADASDMKHKTSHVISNYFTFSGADCKNYKKGKRSRNVLRHNTLAWESRKRTINFITRRRRA